MARAQVVILWCTVTFAAAACLYPPWLIMLHAEAWSSRTPYGRHPLFSAPLTPRQQEEVDRCKAARAAEQAAVDAPEASLDGTPGQSAAPSTLTLDEFMARGQSAATETPPQSAPDNPFADLIPGAPASAPVAEPATGNIQPTIPGDQSQVSPGRDVKVRNPFAGLFSNQCQAEFEEDRVNVAIDLTRLGIELFVVALIGTAAFLTAGRTRRAS